MLLPKKKDVFNTELKHSNNVDNLACDFIKVEYKGVEKYFPVYDIINDDYGVLGPESKLYLLFVN